MKKIITYLIGNDENLDYSYRIGNFLINVFCALTVVDILLDLEGTPGKILAIAAIGVGAIATFCMMISREIPRSIRNIYALGFAFTGALLIKKILEWVFVI